MLNEKRRRRKKKKNRSRRGQQLLEKMEDTQPRQLHVTIQRGMAFPILEKCMTCCFPGLYHCPFCTPAFFKPAKRSKVMLHLEYHLKRACHVGEYTIHKCGLDCAKRPHYHCLYCIAMLGSKHDFNKHIEFCQEMQNNQDDPQDGASLVNRAKILTDGEKAVSSFFMETHDSESEDMALDSLSRAEQEGRSSLSGTAIGEDAAEKEGTFGQLAVTKRDKMLQVNLEKPQDCDEFYFMNLVKMFKKLSPAKKTEVRMKIERVLFEAEFV
ncbi:uncharacterized protein LOC102223114 [Xiphophorus maculatus]|uniref:uncharacterized protein LOC102223114 n=1 Tax=Xiphophorus maculatus TaxID=8083 RepID=UPI0003B6F164|nr:uncharacterized protein LOC102223114 [Xiphophorus maculatus]